MGPRGWLPQAPVPPTPNGPFKWTQKNHYLHLQLRTVSLWEDKYLDKSGDSGLGSQVCLQHPPATPLLWVHSQTCFHLQRKACKECWAQVTLLDGHPTLCYFPAQESCRDPTSRRLKHKRLCLASMFFHTWPNCPNPYFLLKPSSDQSDFLYPKYLLTLLSLWFYLFET